ncbi:50S ribosomal protein L13 [Gammaproteobacteria bacterium]|nr:50S ribosomal protein L13 [Gammaproteobacteria bacterium]
MYHSTCSFKKEDVKPVWHHVDAKDWLLGRLGTKVATVLQGKHKPQYTPHVNNGDVVVICNAKQIKVTGNKLLGKIYYHHTQHPGGIKQINLEDRLEKDAVGVIKSMVKGMLPKGPLGRQMLKNLWVYEGESHPHQAQKPVSMTEDKAKS